MGIESMGDIGPKKFDTVPNPPVSLETESYEKPSVTEALSGVFAARPAALFKRLGELDVTDAEFSDIVQELNEAGEGQVREGAFDGVSLEGRTLNDEPITLANGRSLRVTRSMRGVATFSEPQSH